MLLTFINPELYVNPLAAPVERAKGSRRQPHAGREITIPEELPNAEFDPYLPREAERQYLEERYKSHLQRIRPRLPFRFR